MQKHGARFALPRLAGGVLLGMCAAVSAVLAKTALSRNLHRLFWYIVGSERWGMDVG